MPTYLKHKPTGDIYIATALLMERTDMVELTAKEAGYFTGALKRKEAKKQTAKKPAAKKAAAEKVNPDVVDDIVKTAKDA